MMNEMSFLLISNIFSDFSFERDRPTDRQTDRQSLLYRCFGAPKNEFLSHLNADLAPIFDEIFGIHDAGSVVQCRKQANRLSRDAVFVKGLGATNCHVNTSSSSSTSSDAVDQARRR